MAAPAFSLLAYCNYPNISHKWTADGAGGNWLEHPTICHEAKQGALSNLRDINNAMPHFCTCPDHHNIAGVSGQVYRGVWVHLVPQTECSVAWGRA